MMAPIIDLSGIIEIGIIEIESENGMND